MTGELGAGYTIRAAAGPADRAAALRIRREIFVEEQRIPAELDADDKDARSVHVLAFHRERAVATARISFDASSEAVISRVAVLSEHRGAGLGGELVLALESIARRHGKRTAVLEPHHYLERFYRRLGYRRVAGDSSAGEHRLITMRKRL